MRDKKPVRKSQSKPTSGARPVSSQNGVKTAAKYFLLPNEKLEDFSLEDVTEIIGEGFVFNVQPIENFHGKKKKEKTATPARKRVKEKEPKESETTSEAEFDAKISSLFESEPTSSKKKSKRPKEVERPVSSTPEPKEKKKSKRKEEPVVEEDEEELKRKEKEAKRRKKQAQKEAEAEEQAKKEEKKKEKKKRIEPEPPKPEAVEETPQETPMEITEEDKAAIEEAERIRKEEDALIEKYRPQIEKEQRREYKEKKKREFDNQMSEENWKFYDATGYDDDYLREAFKLDNVEVRLKIDRSILDEYGLPWESEKEVKERQAATKRARRRATIEPKECFNCKNMRDLMNDPITARFSEYCSDECIEATVKKAEQVIEGDQVPVMIMSCGSISQGPPLSQLLDYLKANPHSTPILPARTNVKSTPKPKKTTESKSISLAVEETQVKMAAEIAEKEASVRKEQDTRRQREYCVKNLTDCLVARMKNASMKFVTKDIKQLSKDLETALFKAHNSDIKNPKYRAWMRAFVAAIKSPRNKGFFVRVATNVLSIHTLVSSKPEDFGSEKFSAEIVTDATSANKAEEEKKETAPFTPKLRPPVAMSTNVLDEILDEKRDRTLEHGTHLFDANCQICKKRQEKDLADVLESREAKEKAAAEMLEIKKRREDRKRVYRDDEPGPNRKWNEGKTSQQESMYAPVAYDDDFYGMGGDSDGEDMTRMSSNSNSRSGVSFKRSSVSPPAKKTRSPNLGRIASPEPTANRLSRTRSPPPRFFKGNKESPHLEGETWTARRHESWRDTPKDGRDSREGNTSRELSTVPAVTCPFSINANKPVWEGYLNYGRLPPMYTGLVPLSNPRGFELAKYLPEALKITGRIDHYPVFEMMAGHQKTFTSAVFCTFEIRPPVEQLEVGIFLKMCSDMQNTNKHLIITSLLPDMDAYIISLKPHQDYPATLLPWNGPGIPDVRDTDKLYVVVTCRPMLEGKFPLPKTPQLPLVPTSTLAALPSILSRIEKKPKDPVIEQKKQKDSPKPGEIASPNKAVITKPADNFLPTNFFDLVKKSKNQEDTAPKAYDVETAEISCVEDVALALQQDITPQSVLKLIKRFICLPDKSQEDINLVQKLCMAKIAKCKQEHMQKRERENVTGGSSVTSQDKEDDAQTIEPLSEKERKQLEKEFGLDDFEANNSTFTGMDNLLDQLNQHVTTSEPTTSAVPLNGTVDYPASPSEDMDLEGGSSPNSQDMVIEEERGESSASSVATEMRSSTPKTNYAKPVRKELLSFAQEEDEPLQTTSNTATPTIAAVTPAAPPPPPAATTFPISLAPRNDNKSEDENSQESVDMAICAKRKGVPTVVPQPPPLATFSSSFMIAPPPPPPPCSSIASSDIISAPPPPPPPIPPLAKPVSEKSSLTKIAQPPPVLPMFSLGSAPPALPPVPPPPAIQASSNPHSDLFRVSDVKKEAKSSPPTDGLRNTEEREEGEIDEPVDRKPLLPSRPQTGPRPQITFSEDPEEEEFGTSSGISYSEGEIPMHARPPQWRGPPPPGFPPPPGAPLFNMQRPPPPHFPPGVPPPFGMPLAMHNQNNFGRMPPMGLPPPPFPGAPGRVPPPGVHPPVPPPGSMPPNRGAAGFGHNMSEYVYYQMGVKKPFERPVTPTDSEESSTESDSDHRPIPGSRIPMPGARRVVPGVRPGVVPGIRPGAMLKAGSIPRPQGKAMPGVVVPTKDDSDDERRIINEERARREAARAARVAQKTVPLPLPQTRANNVDPEGYDYDGYGDDGIRRKRKKKRGGKKRRREGGDCNSISVENRERAMSMSQDGKSDMDISRDEDRDEPPQNEEPPTTKAPATPDTPTPNPINASRLSVGPMSTPRPPPGSVDRSNTVGPPSTAGPMSTPRSAARNTEGPSTSWNDRHPDDERGVYPARPHPARNVEDYGNNSWTSDRYPEERRYDESPYYARDSDRWRDREEYPPQWGTPRGGAGYNDFPRDDWRSPAPNTSWRGAAPGGTIRGRGRGGPSDFSGRRGPPEFAGRVGPPEFAGRAGPPDFAGRGGPSDYPGRGGAPDFGGRGRGSWGPPSRGRPGPPSGHQYY